MQLPAGIEVHESQPYLKVNSVKWSKCVIDKNNPFWANFIPPEIENFSLKID